MAMNDRIPPGTYFQYSPSGVQSSPFNTMRPSTASMDQERSVWYWDLLLPLMSICVSFGGSGCLFIFFIDGLLGSLGWRFAVCANSSGTIRGY